MMVEDDDGGGWQMMVEDISETSTPLHSKQRNDSIENRQTEPTYIHWRRKVPKWWGQLNFEPIFRYLQNCDWI